MKYKNAKLRCLGLTESKKSVKFAIELKDAMLAPIVYFDATRITKCKKNSVINVKRLITETRTIKDKKGTTRVQYATEAVVK